MPFRKISEDDQWITNDDGDVIGIRLSGRQEELSLENLVGSKIDPVTGGIGFFGPNQSFVPIEQSVEFFGMRESNSPELNSQMLQNALDAAPGDRRYVISVPPGKKYEFGYALLRKKQVTFKVDGVLYGGTLGIGALPASATIADISAYGSGLADAMELDAVVSGNFKAAMSNTAAIELAYARGITLRNVVADGYGYLVDSVGPASDNFSQAVARVKVLDCDAKRAIIPIRIRKGAGNAVMHNADWQIIGGRHTDTILISDVARTQRNIDAEGIDGLIISGLYAFLSANTKALSTKSQNIRVSVGTNVTINSNQLFEAGEEAVLLDRVSGATVGKNVIAFPGQRVVSDAIRFTGGDNLGDICVKSSVAGNTIEGASGNGVRIDSGCDYITIGPNAMAALGSSARFYGVGSPLGSTAAAVSRESALKNTIISRQATNAMQIKREVSITETGDNKTVDIGDAKVVYLKSASQLNIASFVRWGAMPNDPEDEITVIGITSNTKLYFGTNAGRIALRDGVHVNVSAGDVIHLKVGNDPATGLTRWYPFGESRIGRTRTITTTGAGVAVDIEDAKTIVLSPSSSLSVSSFTRNAKSINTMSDQNESFSISATNGNTTLVHGAPYLSLIGGANVTLASGNMMSFRVINGVLHEVWRNF